MHIRQLRRFLPVAVVAVTMAAFVPAALAVTSASGAEPRHSATTSPGPIRARITGKLLPGGGKLAPYTEPSGPPAKQQQISVLAEALKYMTKHYGQLFGDRPGPVDIFDYGIGPLWLKGIDGAGTTIAVIEGWDFPGIGNVVAGFDKQFHLPNPQIQTIFPAGKLPKHCPPGMVKLGSYGSCSAWQGELALDVMTAHLIAPYAKIVISATPADTQVTDNAASQVAMPEIMKALEYISTHHVANVMSISDGTGETTYGYGRAQILANDPGELAAAAAGIPVLVASGDCGVVQNLAVAHGQCEDTSGTPDTAAWDDSPWTTAVGGTIPNFSHTKPVRLGPDPVWNTPPFAEGAGLSSVFARPAYQNGVARITKSDMRSVPDLTMDSSSGTSEAAPLLAGVLALATQVNHGNVGPINPALYGVLGRAGARDGIADVTTGNNSAIGSNGRVLVPGFAASRGFDVASGWGSVYAPKFVPSLAAATRALHEEDAARHQAAAELASLELGGARLAPTSSGYFYLLAGGFLPTHPVLFSIDGKLVAKLTANPLGDVTYMIDPSLLHLHSGLHHVTLGSMLITEQARFTS
jgi:hypothetical protein